MSSPPAALPPRVRMRWSQLLHLAWRDLWHERTLALCTACVLAATLAPLWLLWGLERGVVGTLIERQDRDPLMRMLEPEATGARRFDDAWFARVRTWPEVAFVMPTVRSTSALVELFGEMGSVFIQLRATAPGDPLLDGAAPPPEQALVLSADAAQRLRVAPGQQVRIALSRERASLQETAAVPLQVASVLPLRVSEGDEGFCTPALLHAIERWREGSTIAAFGLAGNGPAAPYLEHPRFRMHARSIRDVQALAERLEGEGVTMRTQARSIEATLGLQRNLRAIIAMVAAVALAGATVALVALQVATVRRKRREFALLKLTGHGRDWLVAMSCLHAVGVALAGAVLAYLVYALGAAAINAYFADHLSPGEAAVRLRAADLAAGALLATLISLLPAVWGGRRASLVEAADELRDP